MDIKKCQKSPVLFYCEGCEFNCSKKSNFTTHLLTAKHIKRYENIQNDEKKIQKPSKTTKKMPKNAAISNTKIQHQCICNKIFKYYSGLWRHKKKCNMQPELVVPTELEVQPDSSQIDTPIKESDFISEKELILMLINENKEFKQLIIEQNKTIMEMTKNARTNITNTTTNSHNKTFNLQFFLNEQCKNALNITEFVTSIKPQLKDLETTGRLGYVEGVSRIINKNLKQLDMFKRPIHCSDLKREILYIKNDDEWQKEADNKPILTKAIKQVANENIKQIGEWKKEHPNCTDSDSNKNTMYLNIVSNAMSGGTSEEQGKNYEKIISNIAKEVVIEK